MFLWHTHVKHYTCNIYFGLPKACTKIQKQKYIYIYPQAVRTHTSVLSPMLGSIQHPTQTPPLEIRWICTGEACHNSLQLLINPQPWDVAMTALALAIEWKQPWSASRNLKYAWHWRFWFAVPLMERKRPIRANRPGLHREITSVTSVLLHMATGDTMYPRTQVCQWPKCV